MSASHNEYLIMFLFIFISTSFVPPELLRLIPLEYLSPCVEIIRYPAGPRRRFVELGYSVVPPTDWLTDRPTDWLTD